MDAVSESSPDDAPGTLYFRVSSGLKSLIGKDLIVSDFVALFELVKNSFDASAKHVQLVFEQDAIWVIDDGRGMSLADLEQKWLFVAYSAKRDGSENAGGAVKQFAGNKGVGRFSCDRLGHTLTLQTRKRSQGAVQQLFMEWDLFEADQHDEFISVPVHHTELAAMELPKGVRPPAHGTVLCIRSLRDPWDRDKLTKLRAHLEKLINPFESKDKGFKITITAQQQEEGDVRVRERIAAAEDADKPALERRLVNGPVTNFLFSELADKTTRIEVDFVDGGDRIETTLIDRGKLIYRIREKSTYKALGGSGFSCRLYALNLAAKQTFARRLGVPVINFGSVFLFRNGFRVFPVGESGDDTFEIDKRKQQGYARFLGTRDIIGRIDVHGTEDEFKEATSRDKGLVDTPAYRELLDAFRERCLKRLEAYVVGITWQDTLDKMREDASGLNSTPARARVIELVSALASADTVQVVEYASDLVDVLSERVKEFEGSLSDLKHLAAKLGDQALGKRITQAEQRYRQLQEAEARANEAAQREFVARKQAELRARDADEARVRAELARDQVAVNLEEERKRNLFLTAVTSLDLDAVTNLHHQITIHASNMHELIEMQIDAMTAGRLPDRETLFTFLEEMRFANQQVMAISRLATRARFRMESDVITDDLAAYIAQYMENVTPLYMDRVAVKVDPPGKLFKCKFKPIEIAIVMDNLLVNARKHGARHLYVKFNIESKNAMQVAFIDDGHGLDAKVQDPSRMFEKGYSTTDGSGLGLYHSKQVMEEQRGTIEYQPSPLGRGAAFILTFPAV